MCGASRHGQVGERMQQKEEDDEPADVEDATDHGTDLRPSLRIMIAELPSAPCQSVQPDALSERSLASYSLSDSIREELMIVCNSLNEGKLSLCQNPLASTPYWAYNTPF